MLEVKASHTLGGAGPGRGYLSRRKWIGGERIVSGRGGVNVCA
jgi:hypothetical protein